MLTRSPKIVITTFFTTAKEPICVYQYGFDLITKYQLCAHKNEDMPHDALEQIPEYVILGYVILESFIKVIKMFYTWLCPKSPNVHFKWVSCTGSEFLSTEQSWKPS